MNKAILIVICDFLVSTMLTMMTGMVPGHSGGTGVGLDEKTTKVLLHELNRRQFELESMRLQLRESIARSGISAEKQAELQRVTEELIKNIAKQEKLEGKLIAKAADSADMDSLRGKLASEERRRQELETELERLKGDLAGNLQKLAEVSGDLREKRRDNAVLTRQLEQTRDTLGETGKKLDSARKELLDERSRRQETQIKLSAAEKERAAARQDAAASKAELTTVRKELDGTRKELLSETRSHSSTREKLAVSESSRAAAERDAAEKGKALETAGKERDSERARHAETKTELARLDTRSRVQQRDIRTLQSTLKGAEGKLAAANEQVSILKLKLTHNEGTLEAVQQSSAEQKDENRRLNQALMVARMEKREAEGKLEVIRDMQKETVKKLAEKEAEVRKAHEKTTEAVLAAAQAARQSSNAAPVQPVSSGRKEVYQRYAQSILRVEVEVWEKTGIFRNLGGNVVSFYPAVDFGKGRILIAGSFDRFAGDCEKVLDFEKVFKVNMRWSLPYESDPDKNSTPLAGEMLVNSVYPHLAAFKFESRDKNIVPLKAIDFKTLKTRGIGDLSLFKADAEATHSALDGRVSLVQTDEGLPALFIRNTGRGGLFNAVPGDMVLTIQGEFVGIASRYKRLNNADGILVPLFNDLSADWDEVEAVRLRENKPGDYSDFSMKIRELRKKFPRN